MGTPLILYTTGGIQLGGIATLPFYRIAPANITVNGATVSVVTAPAFGSLSSATLVQSYLCEKAAISFKGDLKMLMEFMGTPLQKNLMRGDPTLTLTLQSAGYGTPLPLPGDAIEVALGNAITSTNSAQVALPAARWFVKDNGVNYDADPTKFSVTMELDRINSSSSLTQF